MLKLDHITKRYGALTALDDVSLNIAPGEFFGLLGPNGAGKSTLMSLVAGLRAPAAGGITLDGKPVTAADPSTRVSLGLVPQSIALYEDLSAEQNLRIFGMIYDVPDLTGRIDEMVEMFDLSRYRNTRCGLLSSGEQTRVSLAKALLNKPRLLLLDEPTASIDPSTADTIRGHIRDYAERERGAVLWTSHNMYEVAAVCHRMMLLSRGRILIEGDPKTLPAEHGSASLEDLFIELAREPGEGTSP